MKVHEQGIFNQMGKTLAKPLSQMFANAAIENFTRLFEAYLCILLGKGAGTGWALDAEVHAAKFVIRKSCAVIFDVGANNGEWSRRIHEAFPKSQIFLFEPQPVCQQSILDKKIPNSTLIPKAVSSAKRAVQLYTTEGTSGIASLHQRHDSYFENKIFTSIDVETTTLDSIIENYDLTCIDFIKMDIEGHELAALQGASNSLEQQKIKAFSFEFGSGNINSRTFFRDFWNLLHPLKYRIYRILPSSRLMLIKEYYEDCEYFRGATNYIAVLEETA